MADENDQTITKLGGCIFFLVLLSHMLIIFVDGRGVEFMKNKELLMHEGTVKTIESDDGDVIDCVDIKKQPAFNHPLLKNHTIEMKPHVHSSGIEAENNPNILFQSWLKNGECPEGSVPILRTQQFNHPRRSYPTIFQKKQPIVFENPPNHEYAQLTIFGGKYYGARATINVWNPLTNFGEISIAQIWVLSGDRNELNSIEAGWIAKDGEKQTRIFFYWTSDGYQSTGCYNLECSGFVQTNKNVALGAAIQPVSAYGGKQIEIVVVIHKFNNIDGNWWLQVGDQLIGYWPSSIFTHLADSSDAISWGGEIVNNQADGHHTSTQMGSGHFPNEAFGKASYFTKLGYFDESNSVKDPENLITYVTKPACYDLSKGKDNNSGVYFFLWRCWLFKKLSMKVNDCVL